MAGTKKSLPCYVSVLCSLGFEVAEEKEVNTLREKLAYAHQIIETLEEGKKASADEAFEHSEAMFEAKRELKEVASELVKTKNDLRMTEECAKTDKLENTTQIKMLTANLKVERANNQALGKVVKYLESELETAKPLRAGPRIEPLRDQIESRQTTVQANERRGPGVRTNKQTNKQETVNRKREIENRQNPRNARIKNRFCAQCNYVARRPGHLKIHIKIMHEWPLIPCEKCSFTSTSAKKFDLHLRCHQNGTNICNLCQLNFGRKGDLTRHTREQHQQRVI